MVEIFAPKIMAFFNMNKEFRNNFLIFYLPQLADCSFSAYITSKLSNWVYP